MELAKSRAIVTGAAGGIGLAVVASLIKAGASKVGMIDNDQPKLDAAVEKLGQNGFADRVVSLLADVRRLDELTRAFGDFQAAAGGLESLVNGAGVLIDGAMVSFSFTGLVRYSIDDWQTTIDTNLRGAFLCSQLAAEAMYRNRTKGVIVNVSSISRHGRPGQAAYSASKGGLVSLTATIAQELAPWGIRCASVAPGLIDTPMAENIPEQRRKEMLDRVAVHRMGRADEIAHGVMFCIENDYFNGRVLELDGGTLV